MKMTHGSEAGRGRGKLQNAREEPCIMSRLAAAAAANMLEPDALAAPADTVVPALSALEPLAAPADTVVPAPDEVEDVTDVLPPVLLPLLVPVLVPLPELASLVSVLSALEPLALTV